MLPLHHSTPLIVHKQPSPPISHPSTTIVQSPTSPSATSTSVQRTKFSLDYNSTNITKSNSVSCTYHLPKLTREYYYIKPSMLELKSLFDDNGQCLVEQFTVGHEEYGSVTFYGQIDVSGLNLDQISKK